MTTTANAYVTLMDIVNLGMVRELVRTFVLLKIPHSSPSLEMVIMAQVH